MQPRVRTACWIALALVLGAAVHVLLARESGPHNLQAGLNLQFAQRPSLDIALQKYPKLRPPLYALLLRGWMHFADTPGGLNEALGLLGLGALVLAGRRLHLSSGRLAAAATVWAAAHFVYVNLYQWTAEALVVPLDLLLLVALCAELEAPTAWTAAALGTLTSLLLLARYFSLFYVVPVVAVALSANAMAWRPRLARAAAVLALAALPLAAWMGLAYRETGYLTGVARTTERKAAAEQIHWRESTTLGANVRLIALTTAVDVLSDHRAGVLATVTEPWAPTPMEIALLVVGGACLLGAIVAFARQRPVLRDDVPLVVCAALLAVYVAALVVVWTTGNNDPIHTRFLFPVYPYLLLLLFALHARLVSRWARLALVLVWAMVLGVQLPRSWAATPLPVRFETVSPLEMPETVEDEREEPEAVAERRHKARERRRMERRLHASPSPSSR